MSTLAISHHFLESDGKFFIGIHFSNDIGEKLFTNFKQIKFGCCCWQIYGSAGGGITASHDGVKFILKNVQFLKTCW